MGLYVQGRNNSSNRGFRRNSIGDLDLNGEEVKDNGQKIDLGRDRVINPNDIQAILRKKRKETSIYR